MQFSLIIATVDREEPLRRLLSSLRSQTFVDFEVIIADQNADQKLEAIVEEFEDDLEIRHLRTPLGLSRSRNAALRAARAPFVAFPDDDSWYPEDLLERVNARLRLSGHLAGVSGRCVDEKGRHSAGGYSRRRGDITPANAWKKGVSATLFVRADAVHAIGGFDEGLGLGSGTPFQSGEETDLVLRLVKRGSRVAYFPDLTIYHPRLPWPEAPGVIERAFFYGAGMGRVLQKHQVSRTGVALHVAGPLAGAAVAFATGKSALGRLRLARAFGRFLGWRTASNDVSFPAWLASSTQPAHAATAECTSTLVRNED